MSKKILIADDDQIILKLLESRLKANGFLVITATSGEEACKMAEQNKPDLIILDVVMPGIGGLQAAKKIKQNPTTASIPIIMLTAATETDVISTALDAGAIDYIVKPFQTQILMEKINKVLKK